MAELTFIINGDSIGPLDAAINQDCPPRTIVVSSLYFGVSSPVSPVDFPKIMPAREVTDNSVSFFFFSFSLRVNEQM